MTTEDDFQNAIDAQPENWQTRLVFADWLDERNDPRASGYRAIAVQRLYPLEGENKGKQTWWWHSFSHANQKQFNNIIPSDWFALLPPGDGNAQFWPVFTEKGVARSRRECEDALALAFAKLPMPRRAELLTPPPAAVDETPPCVPG